MRCLLLLSVSLTLLVPAAAHADTPITFSADGITLGTTIPATPSYVNIGFTVPPTAPGYYDYAGYYVTFSNGDSGDLIFYAADEDAYFGGSFDLAVFDFTQNINALLDGPTLFTGPATDPAFIPGDYTLTAEGYDIPVAVTIGSTPEPSSLVLLGTGVLSLAAAARRRFRA